MRTLVLGDIHGHFLSLMDVLEQSEYNPQEDKIIFLGDYVDRGPDSFEVIKELITIKEEAGDNAVFIRGNHDQMLIDLFEENMNEDQFCKYYFANGGQSTVDSYQRIPRAIKLNHLNFLLSTKYYHVDEDNNVFVHAGWESHKGIGFEKDPAIYFWTRQFFMDASSFLIQEEDINMDRLYSVNKYNKIFIGHTRTKRLGSEDIVKLSDKVVLMDTGSGKGGKLSLYDITNDKVYTSNKNDIDEFLIYWNSYKTEFNDDSEE